MVFEVPLNVNNKKIRKTKKIRYKYKFFLNKYHQENEAKKWCANVEIGKELATPSNDDRRTSVLTPQPSEFETEHENSESNHEHKKKIDYETIVLSKYHKPEDQYEQWYPSSTSFQKQRQAHFPMLKNNATINESIPCVHASYVEKLKKQACSGMTNSELQWLAKDIQKHETCDDIEDNALQTSSTLRNQMAPMEHTYMGKHVYNIIQIWHFAMLDHKWDKAYRCFSILLRIPNVDIRSIWSLGCATLKNHQHAQILEAEKRSGSFGSNITSQNNANNIGVFSFNPQFSVSDTFNKKNVNANQLSYMKFLEWMCTVFSSRTHFNQNLNYMMDPVWRKGSYKHTPVYVYTWLWSLLVESSTLNLENLQSQQTTQNGFSQNSNDDMGDDVVQWIIEKINDMILTPPYMDDPMIKYIQACAHLVKADELVSGPLSTRRRNTAIIGQHVLSCKKLLRMISSSQVNASIDKKFCFNKRFIEKQLQIIEKHLYIEESEDESEDETRQTIVYSDPPLPKKIYTEETNSLHGGLDDLRSGFEEESLDIETQTQQGDDFADDSIAYDSDVYARLENDDEDNQEIDTFHNDHHYSSSD